MMNTKSPMTANGGNIQHTLTRTVDKATIAAHETIDYVADAARPALDHLASNAHGTVDHMGVGAARAAEALGTRGDQLNDNGKKMVERAGEYVRENPVASLGMAVAAGYILSRLLSAR
jgi:ElaB/YqjD/DUF883 family membrane-anchored ribosome-binding protein